MTNGMISAIDLARYVIWYACSKRQYITNLKLQKLLYYLQGEYLQKNNRLLFSDDIQAWPYGPVVPSVYFEYCGNGAMWLYPKDGDCDVLNDCDIQLRTDINAILDKYLPHRAGELVARSHQEIPWQRHAEAVGRGLKPSITEDDMRAQFCE